MAYEVLARKWRPKNFSELIGQSSVKQILINAVKQNRLYPVLLFTGPRGTGKTSSARILAKVLRCSHKKDFIPCDKCEDCRFIQESRHLDVIEIDGASNNGVDAIRELRDTVKYMPSTGLWKIYIIDEAHMLSNSAFNALLKTFEEPPKHILFIMATTESHKIPQTVLSRSQRLDFYTLPPKFIKEQLEKICKTEKVSVPEDVLWIISKQARGSLRDGQSLLDQVITFCGEDLRRETVTELLGLSDPLVLFKCLKSILHRKEEKMIEVIEDIRIKGIEPKLFLQNLIEVFRNLIILKKNPDNEPELVQASKQEIAEMKQEIELISYEDLHFLFDMLLKGEKEIAFCYDNNLVLEVLLLRFCGAPRLESIIPLNPLTLAEELKQDKTIIKTDEAKDLKAKNSTSQENESQPDLFVKRNFLEFLKKTDIPKASLLEKVDIKKIYPRQFCFTIPENFPYLKKGITSSSSHKFLEEQLTDFLKSKTKVKIEFSYSNKDVIQIEEEKNKTEERFLKQIQNNSFVNEVRKVFGGDIQSIIKTSR